MDDFYKDAAYRMFAASRILFGNQQLFIASYLAGSL